MTNTTRQASLYRYQLPMDSGVIVRQQRLLQREGLIIELSDNERMVYAEVAPLPSFSDETVEQAQAQLLPLLELWQATGQWPQFEVLYPSVAFGLSMAQLELNNELPAQGQYLTAPLCSGDPDELLPVFEKMQAANLLQKVAKVKVGLYEPIRDGMLVNLFLESIPDLYLRLDANRSWQLAKALKFAQYIAPEYRSRIAFLEEPCQTPEQSVQFAQQTGINIGWDETVQQSVQQHSSQAEFNFEDLCFDGVNTIVIKPTLIGSIARCIELIEQAEKNGLQAVISSSLESTIGLTQLARFAAWKTPQQVPGLDTLQLFKAQLQLPWPESTLPVIPLLQQQKIWSSVEPSKDI
ncbi:o-succinylbenzoate synthase [Vibrio algicola]|uniref:o-succinylbenzoate synthase n=1 Tax=Vibrio algicola TaxID=2662262 RepID=A0A5Q0TH52_9VIBR|nr:o-succinylbenzoate synthase [Vibrio algicola]